ncbi:2-octaprenyl-6-methoxyphenyl hydroxylase [Volucribacter amazonae]|uniref:2-octaprenyl-6-methoxyphenyl hydroxylase n=1 Tax=Volucribacter amazonae TaxID=256731 RepID=A0A9X4PCF5_9PAST|nr:2-octaprenyl-6-methoxyphenyl hydroxylase [Volucribacter amazonae]MDG6895006.1 2-octaprenyl-6-methoxyphenyl hydroxylase [Volucribacter amazonae]
MTGATLALALANNPQYPLKIAVIERQPQNFHQQQGFDARCIALAQGSCQRFAQIPLSQSNQIRQHLWQAIQSFATPIKQIHVSDKGKAGIVQFHAEEFHLDQLGAVVELHQVGKLLLEQIALQPHIDYFCPDEMVEIIPLPQHIQVTLKSQRILTAKLLVGADGVPSKVAQLSHIPQQTLRDYQQTAIITNIQTQQDHQYRAFERFTSQGPIALLPLGEKRMTLVWCVTQIDDLLSLSEQTFLAKLQQAFGWRLGKLEQCGQRFAYPLKLIKAEQYIQPRVVLVGNAAQTLHPIAGQGFNLAIRDILALSEYIQQQVKQGTDFGDYTQLQHYQQQRQQDQANIINLTDGLVSLFANDLLPMKIGRNFGLLALAQSCLLRQHFAKQTLGWV